MTSVRLSAANSFHLRPATGDDATEFLKLVIALAEFEKLEPPDEFAQRRLIADAFGDRPRIEVWLAFAESPVVPAAYAIFLETYSSFLAKPTLYVEDIYVREDFRRRGIGTALMRKAVELADSRGCGRVEWTALDWNTNAQRVYEEKLGARRLGDWYLYRMTRAEIGAFLRRNPA